VRETSDGKPYVILGSHEHVLREGAFEYDVEAMTSAAERLALEAGRLVAKCRAVVNSGRCWACGGDPSYPKGRPGACWCKP